MKIEIYIYFKVTNKLNKAYSDLLRILGSRHSNGRIPMYVTKGVTLKIDEKTSKLDDYLFPPPLGLRIE